MMQIHPVSDLRNKEYASLTDNIEMKLDEADGQAVETDERLSHESVFKSAMNKQHWITILPKTLDFLDMSYDLIDDGK